MSVAVQSAQAAQQAPAASVPEAEKEVPATHAAQVPAAPTAVCVPHK